MVKGSGLMMPEAAVRGLQLFNGRARCVACHHPPLFSDQSFHNIGVGMDQPEPDIGREAVTRDARDRGKFKTPGLRNVALTWPYLHDGSAKTLEEVIAFYNKGGVSNPTLDPLVAPLGLTPEEQKDLVSFLEALTGQQPDIARPALPD